jgi:hypothetical protein
MAKDPYKSQGDSDSPQATRRGNADRVDINQNSPGSQSFGELNYDSNPREGKATPEAMGAGETDTSIQAPGPEVK